MEDNITFKHTMPAQLRFSDVVRLGHVHNSVSVSLYDLAKTTYLHDVMAGNIDWDNGSVVIANIQANFLAPVFFGEPIAIQTATTRIGHKSFTLMQRAVNMDSGEVKCTCQTVMVGYDVKAKQSQLIPEEYKRAICAFEGRDDLVKE